MTKGRGGASIGVMVATTASQTWFIPLNNGRRVVQPLSSPSGTREPGRVALFLGAEDKSPAPILLQRAAYLADFSTWPPNSAKAGLLVKAAAVKSNNHDEITLPRRHTSATADRLKSY